LDQTSARKRVGLIGAGAIGSLIADACEKDIVNCSELVVFDTDRSSAERLKAGTTFPIFIVGDLEELIAAKPAVVVEAASQEAARQYVPRLVEASIEVVVLSTGALLQLTGMENKVHMPSGAIGGLDAIAAAALAGIDEVTLTTRKPPTALELTNTEPKVIYEGVADDAAMRFPREMNVAATLALTVKPTPVKVRVVSDPAVTRNTHEIHVKWRLGEMSMLFANDPHPANPRTSALAAWAAIRLLQKLLLE
jgi:aspartate dehydrogenase